MKILIPIFTLLSLFSCRNEPKIEYPKYLKSKYPVSDECTSQFAEIISPYFGFDKRLFKPNTISIIEPNLDSTIYKDDVWNDGVFIEFNPRKDSLSIYYYYINPALSLVYFCYQINNDTELIINNTTDVLITDFTTLNKNKCLGKIYPAPAQDFKKEEQGFGSTGQMFKIAGTWNFNIISGSKTANVLSNKKITFERNGNAYLLDALNDTIDRSIFPDEVNAKLIFNDISFFVKSCTKHGMILESEDTDEYYKIIKQK